MGLFVFPKQDFIQKLVTHKSVITKWWLVKFRSNQPFWLVEEKVNFQHWGRFGHILMNRIS